MSIQTDLQAVTNEIAAARLAHMEAEVGRLVDRRRVNEAETALATARIALMARNDAGPNDTARRAYAERETVNEREALALRERLLTDSEINVVATAATLRIAEDRRRYLETMVTLTVTRAAADALHIAYADNGDRDPIGVLPTLNDDDETEMPF